MTLFSSALIARFGVEWQFLADEAGVHMLAGLPDWILSDTFIMMLGIFSIIEHIFQRTPELQQTLELGESQLKGVFAFFLCFFLVQGNLQDIETHIQEVGVSTDFAGFLSVEYAWSFLIGGATWFVAMTRRAVYEALIAIDPNDDIQLQRSMIWFENGLGIVGPMLIVLFPLFGLVTALIAVATLAGLKRYFQSMEAKQKKPCPNCQQDNHLSANQCGGCHSPLERPYAVGLFGQAKEELALPADQHRLALLQSKRCPSCAEQHKGVGVQIQCERCDTLFFPSESDGQIYLKKIEAKLPKTLFVSTLLSLIPVIGIIPGIIFYRLYLIRGLRVYLPRLNSFGTRWLVRLLCLALLMMQTIPLVGALAIPLMALINYVVYSRALKRQFRLHLATQAQRLTSPAL